MEGEIDGEEEGGRKGWREQERKPHYNLSY